MNIEKALRNYIRGTGPKVKYEHFLAMTQSDDGSKASDVLFSLINEEIDTMTDTKVLDRTIEVMKYIGLLLANKEQIDRNLVNRKLHKLGEKLSRIEVEGKNKFNMKHIHSEFDKVRRQLDDLTVLLEDKEPKKYELMRCLIDEIRDLEYLDCTLKNMPSLVNVQDKDNVPLFRNLVNKYLENIEDYDEENIQYYSNIISYIMSQKSFSLSEREKKECLEDINTCLNKLTYKKKAAKANAKKIEWINRLVELIKELNSKKKDITEIADKYNVQVYFDDEIIEQAKLSREEKEGKMRDRQILDDYIITIDGADALEIDDALSCKKLPNGNYLLGVHIASVLGYFEYTSDIVQEALTRTKAIYLPAKYQTKDNDFRRAIPIFPYSFSADAASLIENSPKLARTFYFEIDKNGNLVKEKFIKSVIRNNRKMTYQEVNDILEHGTEDEKLQETINNLKIVTNLLDKKTNVSKLYRTIKENTDDISELRVKKLGSENIVYQAMLLTGTRVATFFSDHNYPCLYRVHKIDKENSGKLQAIIDNITENYGGKEFKNLYKLLEGIYPKGYYATEGRHDGLGKEHYCHCTSGLRRAADIVVEHALEVCYDKTPTEEELAELEKEIEKRAEQITKKQAPIEWFIEDYRRVYKKKR